uniref:Maestro/Maestro-like HEAT-repeats domain-containing protein n=1 Tax=Aquila chrysaetos chrysaetos TaxID=223781 RepID=A0A663F5A3_AQUCH
MKDPPIREKKFLESVLGILLEKSQHRISAVRQMAVRGLGNAFRGAPKEVHKHKTTILEVLQRGLENTRCPVLAAESMLALAEVVRKLKAKGLGSAFKDILTDGVSELQEPDVLRFSAFSLYAVLASSASGKRSFFTREVWETWVSLLLHLRDPDPEASNVRAPPPRSYLQNCRKPQKETIVTSIGLGAAQLQYEVYHCLVSELCPGETSRPQGLFPRTEKGA